MERAEIREGMSVYSADGERLGKIVSCEPTRFTIEKGIFFKKDYIAQYEDVSRIEGDDAWLLVAKDQLPVLGDEDRTRTEELGAGAAMGGTPVAEARERVGSETSEKRIPLVEEELLAEKTVQKAGEVRVHKDVVTEEKEINVPVVREDVHVERVAAERAPAGSEAAFKEEEIVVPVYEEEVEVRKRPVVREEVRVGKTSHVEEMAAGGTVRKEEVEIEDESARARRRDDEDPDTRR
jgi:uncharacterized protein (TIGR02271 family)